MKTAITTGFAIAFAFSAATSPSAQTAQAFVDDLGDAFGKLETAVENKDLSGWDLTGAHVVDLVKLAGGDGSLASWNFEGADLSNVALDGTDLSGANMDGVSLVNAFVQDSNWSNVSLYGATISGVGFDGVDLRGADFSQASMIFGSFQNADLRGAIFHNTSLISVDLTGANLSGATWIDGQICAEGSIGACN